MTDTTNKSKLADLIKAVFTEVFDGQDSDLPAPKLKQDTILLDTGLDSLGFAILVTRLEEELEFDPFSLSDEAYYPQTFGEFLDFYHSNRPT